MSTAARAALPPPSSYRTCVAVAFVLIFGLEFADNTRLLGWQLLQAPDILPWWLKSILRAIAASVLVAAMLYAVERLPWVGARKWLAAAALLLISVFTVSLGIVYVAPWSDVAIRLGLIASPTALVLYFVWFYVVTGVLALVTLEQLRRRRQAVERLAAVQEQSRATRQQLAHSKLQAIQARVDPRFLFDMLGAVKRFYAVDAQRAERLLDGLNAFLRAALPRLRSARSSLGVEVELVACQQRLLQDAFDLPAGFAPRVPESLADAVFPAGVLLPLTAAPADHGAQRIELEAEAEAEAGAEQRLRVRVAAARAPGEATLERLRRALADLYGEHAQLRLVPGPMRLGAQATTVELELPHERE